MSIRARGTTLAYLTGTTYNVIPGIKSFTPPNRAASGVLDGSDHDSTAVEKILTGLVDNGQVTFGGNYDSEDTDHQWLEDNAGDDTAKTFRIVYKAASGAGATHTFSAFVRDFSTAANHDGLLEFSATLELTGAITRS